MQQKILSLPELQQYNLTALSVECSRGIAIDVPCPSIASANSNVDIANDYLFALFLGETILKYCETICAKDEGQQIRFVLQTIQVPALIDCLLWFSHAYNSVEWPSDFENEFAEFALSLEDRAIYFVELGDRYLANLIAGFDDLYDEVIDRDSIQLLYQKHPERRYGYWRSFASYQVGYDFYVSPWAWVVPHDIEREKSLQELMELLELYGGFTKGIPSVENASRISIDELPSVVFNQSAIMRFPEQGIRDAQNCAAKIWKKLFAEKLPKGNLEYLRPIFNGISSERWALNEVLLSEHGYLLIAKDSMAYYLYFQDEIFSDDTMLTLKSLPESIKEEYWNALDEVVNRMGVLSGQLVNVELPWERLDDEKFEQLCYDIIIDSEQYDPDTRQKFGKSRSRDGGRDIEIYSRARLGQSPTKWIVQCKLQKSVASLSGSKVHVSDTVEQYAAGGYCIMTNSLIDATLHDKLEQIAQRRGIGIDRWDRLRIERTLAKAKYQNIRRRYFEA